MALSIFTPAGRTNAQTFVDRAPISQRTRDPNFSDIDVTGNLVANLGERMTIRIDPVWLANYREGWTSPLGPVLSLSWFDAEEGLTENGDPSYAETEVVGRAESYKTWVGAANREISMTVRFQAQGVSGEGLAGSLQKEVVLPAKWLDALKYPYIQDFGGFDGRLSHAPPPVIVRIGRLFVARCIVSSATITWRPPFDPATMLPYAAEVACSFVVTRNLITNYNHDSSER